MYVHQMRVNISIYNRLGKYVYKHLQKKKKIKKIIK